MPYGDSESNHYRIGDLEKQIGELRSEFLSYQNNINFDISDLKESVATNSSAIADLQKFTVDQLKNFPVVLGSVKAVRDIAMAEITAMKADIDALECSSIIDTNLIKALTKTAAELKDVSNHVHPKEIVACSNRIFKAESNIIELQKNQEKIERLYTDLMDTPITELVDKMEKSDPNIFGKPVVETNDTEIKRKDLIQYFEMILKAQPENQDAKEKLEILRNQESGTICRECGEIHFQDPSSDSHKEKLCPKCFVKWSFKGAF